MLNNLFAILDQSGLQSTYGKWSPASPPSLPYLVVMESARDDLYADGSHYKKFYNFTIELYFAKKDPLVEEALEGLFDANDISWSVGDDIYIDTDRYFERPYYIEMEEK